MEDSEKSFRNYLNTYNTVLNKQLSQKNQYVRGYQSSFMNKSLSKSVNSLLRKTKRELYSNLDDKNICNKISWFINTPSYSSLLKRGDITSVHKRSWNSVKNNYKPINILSNTSKLNEGIMLKQTLKYFESLFLPQYQCRFRKSFSV